MKKLGFVIFVIVACLTLKAQNSGNGFNYQAVARDANGLIRKTENIEIKFSLLANGSEGASHWVEQHEITTDPYGTFAVIIGKGIRNDNSLYDKFSDLDFRLNRYWLKIEVEGLVLTNHQLLSVPYAENVSSDPVGTVNAYAGIFHEQLEAEGWLPCDGRIINKDDYPKLWNAIQEYWGNGGDGAYDAENNMGGLFHLPDLRGQFLRGVDQGAGNDPDAADRKDNEGKVIGDKVGSYQPDQYKNHRHGFHNNNSNGSGWSNGDGGANVAGNTNTNGSGGSETRPKNAYVNYIIKVK